MKFVKVLFFSIVILYTLLKLTIPGEKAFASFAKSQHRDTMLISTEYEKQTIFAIGMIHQSVYNGIKDVGKPINYIVPHTSTRYIGLLGKFWVLK